MFVRVCCNIMFFCEKKSTNGNVGFDCIGYGFLYNTIAYKHMLMEHYCLIL